MSTNKKVWAITVFVALMTIIGLGGAAQAQLAAVSVDLDPVNGYPVWYEDSTGLRLQLCTDLANCVPAPVDPANPASVALGVGDETFYWGSDALIPIPTGNALLVLALEAAFGGPLGVPVVGDQITFARVRIRIDAPVAGTYTVTHPFGVEVFNVVTPGPTAINFSSDIGCAVPPACNFSVALAGGVGPFLMWDPAVAPPAPAGFLGNVNLPHQVIGSPLGTNFFRVDGPAGSNLDGLGGTSVQTDLFNVQGQIFRLVVPAASAATYFRDAAGAGLINISVPVVGATSAIAAGTESPIPGEPVDLMAAGLNAAVAIDAGTVLPANIFISLDAALASAATGNLPLNDVVSVTQADFNAGTLTVSADSSDNFTPPVLTVTSNLGAPLGTIDTAVSNTLSVGVAAAPASVSVTSASGGAATMVVTDLTAPVAPPAGGGAAVPVPGGGGGGGGGCFISELFN